MPIEDPTNYRRVLQRIKKLLSDGTYLILPHAKGEAASDKLDDTDILNIIRTGAIRANSHAMGRNGWTYVVEGQSLSRSQGP